MCLQYIDDEIQAEEHFQHIRWKAFRVREGALFPTYTVSNIPGDELEYTIGALHFFKLMYSDLGMYAFVTEADCDQYKDTLMRDSWYSKLASYRPVLMGDIVQTGEWMQNMRAVVAKICYLLTDKEYEYLQSDHRPIQLNEDSYEIPMLEEI